MKRSFLTYSLALGIAASSALWAQTDSAQPANQDNSQGAPEHGRGGPGGMGMHKPDPDRQTQMLTKKLKLTADQQTQIKGIFVDADQQMETLHSDTSMSRDDKRSKMMSMRQDTNAKITAVLNDDQKKKFADMQQQMREHMMERRGAGPGPGGEGPAGGNPNQ